MMKKKTLHIVLKGSIIKNSTLKINFPSKLSGKKCLYFILHISPHYKSHFWWKLCRDSNNKRPFSFALAFMGKSKCRWLNFYLIHYITQPLERIWKMSSKIYVQWNAKVYKYSSVFFFINSKLDIWWKNLVPFIERNFFFHLMMF